MKIIHGKLQNPLGDEKLLLEFEDEEWDSMLNFDAEVAKLLATSFLKSASNFHLSINFSAESQKTTFNTNAFNEEHWAAFLHFFRPMAGLNMDQELYGFLRIRRLIEKRCKSSKILSARLAELLKQFQCRLLPFQTEFNIDGRSYDLEGIFALWMNAREFHRDTAKASVLNKMNNLMPNHGIRILIANLAVEKLRAMVGLQQLIKSFGAPPGTERPIAPPNG